MFQGLCAFPLTPMNEFTIQEHAFELLIRRLVDAGVPSIGVLGSTGNYAYLTQTERLRVLKLAIASADGIPVMTSISSLRTLDIMRLAEDAQKAGAKALLMAPISYQTLTDDEVFLLYKQVTHSLSIPLCVYDNPGTSHFHFTDELYNQISQLPNVKSIKIPSLPLDTQSATRRIQQLKSIVSSKVTIGISGDPSAVQGLQAGCEVWYSVLGGLFPKLGLEMTRLAQTGFIDQAHTLSNLIHPIWLLFSKYGSLRVVSAIAEIEGWVSSPSLPLPLLPVHDAIRNELKIIIQKMKSLETTQLLFS